MDRKLMPMMVFMVVLAVVGTVFAFQGVMMHARVAQEEAKLHAIQERYFIQAKEDRDAAPTGSATNQDLVEISKAPSRLLELKLIGVGKILTGIFVLLFGIFIALVMMPVRLAQIIRGS